MMGRNNTGLSNITLEKMRRNELRIKKLTFENKLDGLKKQIPISQQQIVYIQTKDKIGNLNQEQKEEWIESLQQTIIFYKEQIKLLEQKLFLIAKELQYIS